MAEYIKCRNCESPDCKGCNLKRLEMMLENGKFDCLMNENRCINTAADVAPVRYGRWIEKSAPARKIYFECSHCGAHENKHTAIKGYYCWRCGARMDGGDGDAVD